MRFTLPAALPRRGERGGQRDAGRDDGDEGGGTLLAAIREVPSALPVVFRRRS
jgi:hypothetical protein